MRVLPILFNTDMVRALLEKRKTVTRRVIKGTETSWSLQGMERHPDVFLYADGKVCTKTVKGIYATFEADPSVWVPMFKAPYEPGDILYVRETWVKAFALGKPYYIYKADDLDGDMERLKIWRPSIHMPKDAARIFLRVKSVRVEKLQDSFFAPISPILELRAEGLDIGDDCRHCIATYGNPCCVDTVDEDGSNLYGGDCGILDEIRGEYSNLWDSTVKPKDLDKYGWVADPWVWVIDFERVEKPEGWL